MFFFLKKPKYDMTKKTHLFLKNILMKNPPLKILKNVWVNEHSKPAKMWQKISNLATTEKTEIRSRYRDLCIKNANCIFH